MGQGLKLPDWKIRLIKYIQSCDGIDFSWTHHSCVTFVAGAVSAMTGIDYWEKEIAEVKKIKTRSGALKYMTKYGGSITGTFDKAFAGIADRIESFGHGDIVVAINDGTYISGVCTGRLCAFISGNKIIHMKPEVITAWSLK